MSNKTFGIGETSLQTRASERQLRHWETAGYIKPERVVCGDRAYRRYTPEDISFIRAVIELLDEGYTLKVAVHKAKEQTGGSR